MNVVILVGRLCADPTLRYSASNIAVCNFTIAVDRSYKQDGEQTADFINCVAWRQAAEFISKYFNKGKKIALTGSIQTRSWEDQEGKKRYSTEVVVSDSEFVESKKESNTVSSDSGIDETPQGSFFVLDDDDGDIPF